MNIKPHKTYTEQIAILQSKGLLIGDNSKAVEFLKRVNYYRLSAYLHAYKQSGGMYQSATTFDMITDTYIFDKELRSLLLKAVIEIELYAKSIIAYHHGQRHGPLGYMESSNFNSKHNHIRFLEQFKAVVNSNKAAPFVRHHQNIYEGSFPIWVAVELFTFGMISIFYADLAIDDKKTIAKEFHTDYTYLQSWLHSASVLRNLCAHHSRLYNVKFHQNPKLPREFSLHSNTNDSSLFKQLYMLKLLFINFRDEWNTCIVVPLYELTHRYHYTVSPEIMGFPNKWEDVLTWIHA